MERIFLFANVQSKTTSRNYQKEQTLHIHFEQQNTILSYKFFSFFTKSLLNFEKAHPLLHILRTFVQKQTKKGE